MKKLRFVFIIFALCLTLSAALTSCKNNTDSPTATPEEEHEHNYYLAETKAASCTEDAYKLYVCSCGDSYIEKGNKAFGHKLGEYNECEYCKTPLGEHIHVYQTIITAPTCTEGGYTTYYCKCEDSYKDDYTSAAGHNYVNDICDRCGDKLKTSQGLKFFRQPDNNYSSITGIGTCTDSEIRIPGIYIKDIPVISIDAYAFYECESITGVIIPSSINAIHESAFAGCENLKSVTLPDSITCIAAGAFDNCPNLSFYEYEGAYYLGNESNPYLALIKAKDTSIISCTVNENTKIIADNAFYGCDALLEIKFNGKLETIGKKAFCGCSAISEIAIPESILSICDYAFQDCKAIEKIYFNAANMNNSGNYAFENAGTCGSGIEVTVGNIATAVPAYLFSSLENPPYIVSLEFEEESICKSIGNNSFTECDYIKSIRFPQSVEYIGIAAFYNCRGLLSVTLPSNLKEIGSIAFDGCRRLLEIYNFSSLNNIRPEFATSPGHVSKYALDIYTSEKDESKLWQSDDGFVFYENGDSCYLIEYCGREAAITTPEDCHGKAYEIYKFAFLGDLKLESIKFSANVTYIGFRAFNECKSLKNIEFAQDSKLEEIEEFAFQYCISLTGITIPADVTKIDCFAFDGCEKLLSIAFEDTDSWYSSDIYPNSTITALDVTDDEENAKALKNCNNLYWFKASDS